MEEKSRAVAVVLCSMTVNIAILVITLAEFLETDLQLTTKVIYSISLSFIFAPLNAMCGIMAKKPRSMIPHLCVQFTIFLSCALYVVSLLYFGPPSSIHTEYVVRLTDEQQILIFLLTQYGIVAGLSLLFFIIILKYYLKIKRENAEFTHLPLEVDDSCVIIPIHTPEYPRKADALKVIPLPWPKTQETWGRRNNDENF